MDTGVRRDDILIWPTGCLAICVSTPVSKNIPLRVLVDAALLIPPSHPSEGHIAIVTDAGRDAVDAAASGAQSARGRMTLAADGKAVWSWRPDAGVKFAGIRERRWQESPVTEESTK